MLSKNLVVLHEWKPKLFSLATLFQSWCMVSVYLSVCLSLAGDARGLWGERRATTKALNPSHYTTIPLLLLEYGPLTTIVVDKWKWSFPAAWLCECGRRLSLACYCLSSLTGRVCVRSFVCVSHLSTVVSWREKNFKRNGLNLDYTWCLRMNYWDFQNFPMRDLKVTS